ncbi:MAG: histidine phosphatase family protein, partial [bacterium]|nr:histidine phosphatase family protein [bacterium]
MKKTVYFVRHGQSEGNVGTVFQPLNSPLTEKGREQAEYIAERAASLSFESVVSSPLTRARETAEAIAKRTKKSIEFSDLFVE